MENQKEGDEAAAFGAFWESYPRKVGKAEACKRWARLTRKDQAAATAAAGHLADYATGAGVDLQYIPHPGTFIGPKRTFEDWSEGLPAGYAAHVPPKADSGPILCLACEKEVTPDDFFEATYIDDRGWVHEACYQRKTA